MRANRLARGLSPRRTFFSTISAIVPPTRGRTCGVAARTSPAARSGRRAKTRDKTAVFPDDLLPLAALGERPLVALPGGCDPTGSRRGQKSVPFCRNIFQFSPAEPVRCRFADRSSRPDNRRKLSPSPQAAHSAELDASTSDETWVRRASRCKPDVLPPRAPLRRLRVAANRAQLPRWRPLYNIHESTTSGEIEPAVGNGPRACSLSVMAPPGQARRSQENDHGPRAGAH